jgi:hypothetical protein
MQVSQNKYIALNTTVISENGQIICTCFSEAWAQEIAALMNNAQKDYEASFHTLGFNEDVNANSDSFNESGGNPFDTKAFA